VPRAVLGIVPAWFVLESVPGVPALSNSLSPWPRAGCNTLGGVSPRSCYSCSWSTAASILLLKTYNSNRSGKLQADSAGSIPVIRPASAPLSAAGPEA
jgi:hypothetical protein